MTGRCVSFGLGCGLLAWIALGLAACGEDAEGDGNGGGGDGQTVVEVVDARFVPNEITIGVGETVRWNFTGRLPHSVRGDFGAGEVASEQFTGSGTFEHTFSTAGRYTYSCGVHTTRMHGVVTVE